MRLSSILVLSFVCFLIFSCNPEEVIEAPSPEDAYSISYYSGGELATNSVQTAEVRSTLPNPLVVLVKDEEGRLVEHVPVYFELLDSTKGELSDTLVLSDADGLAATLWTLGDSVHTELPTLRAYANVPSSNEVIFAASATAFGISGAMTDNRDGKIYGTTQIGNQIWMAENLRYNLSGSFQNPQNPGIVYGYLYSWDQARNACPTGWHLPDNQEWQDMTDYLSNQVQPLDGNASWNSLGENLKSTTGWTSDNGDNLYNFNAYPAGIRTASGTNLHLGDHAYFWSASDTSATDAYYYQLSDSTSNLVRGFQGDKNDLYSCRCLKN